MATIKEIEVLSPQLALHELRERGVKVFVEDECIGSGWYDFVYTFVIKYFRPEEVGAKRPMRVIYRSYSEGSGTYTGGFDSYKEAELKGLQKAIELVKNKEALLD